MHIFDSNISSIPERLKQFPGINATLDDPLGGICSYEAAAFGLSQPAAIQQDQANPDKASQTNQADRQMQIS
jgi:hypothetical protein